MADTFTSLQKVINYACYGLVAVLAIVSIVVINNTIKITVFNRRKEIGIMKLVGATNGFIRFPFFVEGVTSGLISAGIASGIVCGAYYALCRWYAENPSNLSQMFGGTLVPLESVMLMATAALSRSEISFLPCFTCFMVLYVPFIPCYTFRCLRMLVAVPRPQSTKPSSTKPPTM